MQFVSLLGSLLQVELCPPERQVEVLTTDACARVHGNLFRNKVFLDVGKLSSLERVRIKYD